MLSKCYKCFCPEGGAVDKTRAMWATQPRTRMQNAGNIKNLCVGLPQK